MYKIFITFSFSSISAKIYKYDITIIIKKRIIQHELAYKVSEGKVSFL